MLLSRSREHLAPVNTVRTKANPIHLAVGDIDRDGKLDFVVAQAKDNSIGVFRGSGDGQFTFVCDLPAPNRPVAVALADFDCDGLLDIAVAREGGGVGVFMNDGGGKFGKRLDLPAGNACCRW